MVVYVRNVLVMISLSISEFRVDEILNKELTKHLNEDWKSDGMFNRMAPFSKCQS